MTPDETTSLLSHEGELLSSAFTVYIGTNVSRINAGAFKGCKKLKTVHIKTNKLKFVGKDAFKGISKKAIFKVAKKNLVKYKRLLKLK